MITAQLLQKQNFDAKSASPQEQRLFSIYNQSKQASVVLQSNLATTTQNMVNAAIKPHPHMASVSHLPSRNSIIGLTEFRNSSTSPNAQLTIFYAGSVCVYDDISPEKANDIMLLAGNGSTPTRSVSVSIDKLRSPISMESKDDGFIISQFSPSPLPSPHYVTTHTNFQSGKGSCSNNELGIVRPLGYLATPINHLESPNVASVESAATKMVQPGTKLYVICVLPYKKFI
ncbi:putative transcription factor TIFY family [Lupinus albus]|uniref:Protein TIFY n=1 Tax=Lupinus albus TaxID=3870 RepID=A0A6A4QIT1_LUPAL|nr:putative transcription factor TIFY family [Lupinus albus]